MRLLPREEKFFKDFLDQARIIIEASKSLKEGVQGGPEVMVTAATKITSLEQKGDEIIHNVFTRLNSTFITPLDPEDIHWLASHLDDVLDCIEETAYCLVAYKISPIPHALEEMCSIVIACAEQLQDAFTSLGNDTPMLKQCIEINRLEGLADQLVRRAIVDLFEHESNPITVIKLKEIYETLETTTDRCEDVADVLQGVIVKNS